MYTMQWKHFMLIFRAICIVTTIAIITFWFYKYSLDTDTSLVEYKELYETANDVSPVLSLCFQKAFLRHKLMQYGTNETSFVDFLHGDHYATEMLDINYDSVTFQLTDYLVKGWIDWRNFSSTVIDKNKIKSIIVTYSGFWQNRFYKCFAVESPPEKNVLAFSLLLQSRIFVKGLRPQKYGFVTLLHYPNQILRSVPTIKFFWPLRKSDSTYNMKFVIDGIEVMERRNKHNDPCNDDWQSYDNHLMQQHIEAVGCRALYQKSRNNLSLCNTMLKTREARVDLSSDILTTYSPPCKSLQNIYTTYEESDLTGTTWEGKEQFWVNVYQLHASYKTIVQSR